VLPSDEMRKQIIAQLQNIRAEVVEEDGKYFTKDPSGNRIRLDV
jgi:catechol 2,3-dioxygenase